VAPQHQPVPTLDFGPLYKAVESLRQSAQRYAKGAEKLTTLGVFGLYAKSLADVNARLIQTERAYLNPGGLPRRPWYKHELYSVSRYWDTKPMPAIFDFMEDGNWKAAGEEVPVVAKTLEDTAAAIDAAAAELERATGVQPATAILAANT
jgi:N-acetylated-alpha-linked acidic dipeptidase